MCVHVYVCACVCACMCHVYVMCACVHVCACVTCLHASVLCNVGNESTKGRELERSYTKEGRHVRVGVYTCVGVCCTHVHEGVGCDSTEWREGAQRKGGGAL